MRYEFKLDPIGKPRMTQRDKWIKRDCVMRYWNFKDLLKLQAKKLKFIMPDSGYHLKFYIPMPKSWSKKKQSAMMGKPHQGKPDKDNLEKAFLDAVCADDSYIWDGRVSKFWWNEGRIVMKVYENDDLIPQIPEHLPEHLRKALLNGD
jgi:Holliday junction resolvase RusA-like endonuclease